MSDASPAATMNLVVVNPADSGAPDDQVYVCVVGQYAGSSPPAATVGYLDLSSSPPVMVYPDSWSYESGVYSRTLAQINDVFPGGIPVPEILSARIYFAVGADFPPSEMASSGPPPGNGCQTFYDFAEFDTTVPGDYNINPSTVDFFGISYTIQAVPAGASPPGAVTVGFSDSRQTVVSALWNLSSPGSPPYDDVPAASPPYGNLGIFTDCFIYAPQSPPYPEAQVLRVLSPMSMALGDWSSPTLATECSHFFDEYVNEWCFAPNRTFSFYTKDYSPGSPANTVIWARVSADGTSVSFFTDPGMTTPYAPVPVLGRPSAPWPLPDFGTPSSYHNIIGATADEIDWGFLLIGNAAGPAQVPGSPPVPNVAWAWGNDPAAMAFMISICRGVAHLDEGTVTWIDPSYYYLGSGDGTSTESMPVLYYSSVLHELGIDGLAYALSFDDIYAQNAGIVFDDGATVTLTLCDVSPATVPVSA